MDKKRMDKKRKERPRSSEDETKKLFPDTHPQYGPETERDERIEPDNE